MTVGPSPSPFRVRFAVSDNEAFLVARVSVDRINFSPVACLLDTGATINLIRRDSHLLKTAKICQYTQPRKLELADGSISNFAPINTFIMATFQFGPGVPPKRIKLDIADLGGTEVILGGRFFKEGKIVMDWEKNELEFPSNTILDLLGNDLQGELQDIEDEWAVGRVRALRPNCTHPYELLANVDFGIGQKQLTEQDLEELRGIVRIRAVSTSPDPDMVDAPVFDFDYIGDNEDWQDLEEDEIKALVPEEFHGWKDIFRKSKADKLPPHRACDHRIDLIPDARLTTGPIYRLARREDEWVQEFLTSNCATGHLRQSTAPHSAYLRDTQEGRDVSSRYRLP